MVKYYNRHHTPTFIFNPRNKMFLDTIDIYTIYPSAKLVYQCLELYTIEK